MKPLHLFVILCLSHIASAQAEIYKRIDAEGHVTYSSEPIKGGKRLEIKPLPVIPGSKPSERITPKDFPKVDAQTQKSRDSNRRKILEDELASEETMLAQAQASLKAVEDNPLPVVNTAGVPFRNAEKQAERVKVAQNLVTLHEQNIKALKTELSNLK